MVINPKGLAPWCAAEKWEFGILPTGRRYARVSGRTPCPQGLKDSWLWRLRNDYEQQLPDWYRPDSPQWMRELYWGYFRNPLQNARLFTWGWADQNYTVTVDEGNPDPLVVQRDDVVLPNGLRDKGYQRCTLTRADGATRKFTSYCSDKIVWYSGTQPTGFYGMKFNIK